SLFRLLPVTHTRFRSSSFPTLLVILFFLTDTSSTLLYTLSLHDALPICTRKSGFASSVSGKSVTRGVPRIATRFSATTRAMLSRSEEHTSELQSRRDLVCRLLLEKKKKRR